MKKMKFLLPLLALIVTGCKTNPGSSSSETSTPPTESSSSETSTTLSESSSETSTTPIESSSTGSSESTPPPSSETPGGKAEINGSIIDAFFDVPVYSLMPKIHSDDYELFDDSSDDYPIDLYLDLFDWSADDALDYVDLLDEYPVSADDYPIIREGVFAYVYEDVETYDEVVYGINIFTEAEGTVGPGEKREIDGSIIDDFFDVPVYSLMPKIYSNDYDVFDASSDDYPIDIYLDLFDWSEDDAYDYIDLLDAFPVSADDFPIIREGVFAYVYEDVETYNEVVYGINIFTEADGTSGPVEPGDKDEINGALIDAFFDVPVYSLMPKIYSNYYDVFDDSSEDYPIDLYVDLFDWTEADADAYEELLQDYPLTSDGISIIREGVYAFVYLDEVFYDEPVYGINIFTEAGEGTVDPVEPGEPVEPGMLLTTTISSKYSTHYVPDVAGNINSHLTFNNSAPINVAVDSNDAQSKNIFNNASGEIRLYGGVGNGVELIFTGAQAGLVFVSITVNTTQNSGYSINGGAPITSSGVKTILNNATSISLQNVGASGQVRITSLVIEYIVLED